MKWEVITDPDPIFTLDEVSTHLRLDPVSLDPNGASESLSMMTAAATDYAQGSLSTALMPQTIKATFYGCEALALPRGPLLSIVSLVDANNATDAHAVTVESGLQTMVRPSVGLRAPITVTYQAGYASASKIPASVKLAILAHVGTLYEARESTTDNPRSIVPHSLEDFYSRRRRFMGIR